MAKYNLEPVQVPTVSTQYRTIKTKLPVPESLEIFRQLAAIGTCFDDGAASGCLG